MVNKPKKAWKPIRTTEKVATNRLVLLRELTTYFEYVEETEKVIQILDWNIVEEIVGRKTASLQALVKTPVPVLFVSPDGQEEPDTYLLFEFGCNMEEQPPLLHFSFDGETLIWEHNDDSFRAKLNLHPNGLEFASVILDVPEE